MKVTTNALCHMTKMAAMPIYGKTVKHLTWNQKAHHLETWYAALVTQVLPGMLKWWPWVDLDLFYSKVKIGPFCFCMGKSLSCSFQETIEACEVKVGTYTCSQIYEYITAQGQCHLLTFRFDIFRLLFLKKHLGRLKSNLIWSLHWMLRWNSLFKCSGSHDQDGFQAHI